MLDFVEDTRDSLKRIVDELNRSLMRVADVERRLDNSLRHGKVTDVDTKKQRFRMEIGEQDGTPLKSAWIPYGQFAGDYKQHRPPVKGQQYTAFAPNGELRQAIGLPFTWSDENKSPSDKEDEHVTTYGKKYRLREKEDLRAFTLDKTKQVFTEDKITTSINGGNTPADDNGSKADDESENDQEDDGSSITQEEEKITTKTPGVTVTHDENDYSVEAKQSIVQSADDEITITANTRITMVVGGANVVIEDGKITLTAMQIITDGVTILGSPQAVARVELETGPATLVLGI